MLRATLILLFLIYLFISVYNEYNKHASNLPDAFKENAWEFVAFAIIANVLFRSKLVSTPFLQHFVSTWLDMKRTNYPKSYRTIS